MSRRRGFDKGFLLLLVIVLILVGTGIFLYAQVRTDKITELVKNGGPFTVAIFVTDKTHLVKWADAPQTVSSSAGGSSAAGTTAAGTTANGASGSGAASTAGNSLFFTELFSYDPKTHKGSLLDIPGNVGSLIGSLQKIDRIDVLFKPGKVGAYEDKIASLIGSPISLYIETDMTEIPKIVDLLGGLNLFIANPVRETNTNPMVLLPSGSLTLDGSKVQSYLSYKGPSDSKIELISRRQRFVQALLKAIGEHASLFDKTGVYGALRSRISTDMNRRSLLSFIGLISKLNTEKMTFQRVLGVDRTVGNQVLIFPHYDGRLLRETMQQTLTSLSNPESASAQAMTTRLQILNGTLVTGLAHRTSQIFQSFGYDVVAVGNADRQNYANTEILDRIGNLAQARKVASVIKCTDVKSKPLSAAPAGGAQGGKPATGAQTAAAPAIPPYDVTVILGQNFDGRYCK